MDGMTQSNKRGCGGRAAVLPALALTAAQQAQHQPCRARRRTHREGPQANTGPWQQAIMKARASQGGSALGAQQGTGTRAQAPGAHQPVPNARPLRVVTVRGDVHGTARLLSHTERHHRLGDPGGPQCTLTPSHRSRQGRGCARKRLAVSPRAPTHTHQRRQDEQQGRPCDSHEAPGSRSGHGRCRHFGSSF